MKKKCIAIGLTLLLLLSFSAMSFAEVVADPVVCEDETAWAAEEGGGTRFVDQGNWATYVQYNVGDSETYPLYAGQDLLAGELAVSVDEDNLIVEYIPAEGYTYPGSEKPGDWEILYTHLHIAEDEDGVPRTMQGRGRNGTLANPIPGQFDYSNDVGYYEIPLNDLGFDEGDNVVIAAHADMRWARPYFMPSIEAPEEVVYGDTFEVKWTVNNIGCKEGTQDVIRYILSDGNGDVLAEYTESDLFLESDGSWSFTGEYYTTGSSPGWPVIAGVDGVGDYTLKLETEDTSVTHDFTVTARPLEITADSDSKVYDGTALENDGYSITGGSLADGQTLDSVTVTGSQTEVGSSDNVPSDAVILANGTDVTANYNITYVNGTLTVEAAPVEDGPIFEYITIPASGAGGNVRNVHLFFSEEVELVDENDPLVPADFTLKVTRNGEEILASVEGGNELVQPDGESISFRIRREGGPTANFETGDLVEVTILDTGAAKIQNLDGILLDTDVLTRSNYVPSTAPPEETTSSEDSSELLEDEDNLDADMMSSSEGDDSEVKVTKGDENLENDLEKTQKSDASADDDADGTDVVDNDDTDTDDNEGNGAEIENEKDEEQHEEKEEDEEGDDDGDE